MRDAYRLGRNAFAFRLSDRLLNAERQVFLPEIGFVDELDREPEPAMPGVVGHLKPGDLTSGGGVERIKAGLRKIAVKAIGGNGRSIRVLEFDVGVEDLAEVDIQLFGEGWVWL
jgi:hypothetical protein